MGWHVLDAAGNVLTNGLGDPVSIAHGGTGQTTAAAALAGLATEVTITTTGNIDDLDFSNASTIRMNNASLSTLRGLKAGLAGQRVVIVSVGAGQVDLAHQNAGSTAANRLINFATSANSSLAAGVGAATYEYDSTTARWRIVSHVQGAWISPPFAAGDFGGNGSAMTWTVTSGERSGAVYYLMGRQLTIYLEVLNSTIGGTPSSLLSVAQGQWGGFTTASPNISGFVIINNAGVPSTGRWIGAGASLLGQKSDASNWVAGSAESIFGSVTVAVT